MLINQIKYDLKMFLRERFYLVLILMAPPASYLALGQIFSGNSYSGGLSYIQTYTPTFIILISFLVVFFSFGFDQVTNRVTGVEKRLLITPVTSTVLLLSAIMRALVITSTGFFAITLIGVLAFGLRITMAGILLSYLGLLAVSALLLTYTTALYVNFKEFNNALMTSVVLLQFVMFTGGFSIPVEFLPGVMQTIAQFNPMYHANKIYIGLWNQTLTFDRQMLISCGYLLLLLVVSMLVIKLSRTKKE